MHKKISVVVVTFNEAQKLSTCLKSIKNFADEIIVIDLGSIDKTLKVAKSFGCRVVKHSYVEYVEQVRNFAIAQCSGDFILVLDPDEKVSNFLKKFLRKFTEEHDKGVVNIPRKNIFFGAWISHTNFWPDFQIRFFSRGSVRWQKILHSYPLSSLKVVTLPREERYAIEHYGYSSFSNFLEKQNRYSSIRAQERFTQGERFSFWNLLYFPLKEFLTRYIKHAGFLDGKKGLFLVLALMFYHFATEFKLWELETS